LQSAFFILVVHLAGSGALDGGIKCLCQREGQGMYRRGVLL
jgi:hypothetical protein